MTSNVNVIQNTSHSTPSTIINKITNTEPKIVVFIDADNSLIDINKYMWIFSEVDNIPIEFIIVISKDFQSKLIDNIHINNVSIISTQTSCKGAVDTVFSITASMLNMTCYKDTMFIFVSNDGFVIELLEQIKENRKCIISDIQEIDLAIVLIEHLDVEHLSDKAIGVKYWLSLTSIIDTYTTGQKLLNDFFIQLGIPLKSIDILPKLYISPTKISDDVILSKMIAFSDPLANSNLDRLKDDIEYQKEISLSDIGKGYSKLSEENVPLKDFLSRPEVKLYLSADIISKGFGHDVLIYNSDLKLDIDDCLRSLYRLKWTGTMNEFCHKYGIARGLFRAWLNQRKSNKCSMAMKLFLEETL